MPAKCQTRAVCAYLNCLLFEALESWFAQVSRHSQQINAVLPLNDASLAGADSPQNPQSCELMAAAPAIGSAARANGRPSASILSRAALSKASATSGW